MGLTLWMLQRVTAICMALYATLIYSHFFTAPLTYLYFKDFFNTPFQGAIFVFTVTAISIHAVIGVWTIATDYLKCRCIRYTFLSGYGAILVLSWIDAILCVARLS
jgi:succinate dehydrogenase / fumarate reductase membrane anchor subunit